MPESKLIFEQEHKLIKTKEYLSENVIKCQFARDLDFLPYLKLPFYDPSVLNEYLTSMGFTLCFPTPHYYNVEMNGCKVKVPQMALILMQIELFTLNASHPHYAIVKTENIYHKIRKNEMVRVNLNVDFFDYENNLLCKSRQMTATLNRNKAIKLKQSRSKIIHSTHDEALDEFKFAQPFMVGKCIKSNVFLSELHFNDNVDKFESNGLCTNMAGINHHFQHIGSGDHLNSSHSTDLFLQFSHLVLRSKVYENKLNQNEHYRKYKNIEWMLTFSKVEIKYHHYLEFGPFKAMLLNFNVLNEKEMDKNICINVPFAFEIEIEIIQQKFKCFVGKFIAVPIFHLSKL